MQNPVVYLLDEMKVNESQAEIENCVVPVTTIRCFLAKLIKKLFCEFAVFVHVQITAALFYLWRLSRQPNEYTLLPIFRCVLWACDVLKSEYFDSGYFTVAAKRFPQGFLFMWQLNEIKQP